MREKRGATKATVVAFSDLSIGKKTLVINGYSHEQTTTKSTIVSNVVNKRELDEGKWTAMDYNKYFLRNNGVTSKVDLKSVTDSAVFSTENSSSTSSTDHFARTEEKPPGRVFRYYKQIAADYWNVFPKTDYTYSPASKYYKKEIAPGIPVVPNLSRRPIRPSYGSPVSPVFFSQSSDTSSTLTTTTHNSNSSSETVIHQNISRTRNESIYSIRNNWQRTRWFLIFPILFLLLAILFYLLLYSNNEIVSNEPVQRTTFTWLQAHSPDKTDIATLVSTFSKPFLWTYRAILHLFTTCLFMIPTILSQVFQLLTNCFLIFIQKLSGLPTGSIIEFSKTTEKSSILDSNEIRKIVLDILTEKEKEEANNLNQMKTAVNDQVNFLNDLVVKVNQKLASLENLSESSSTLTRFADIQEYVGHVVKGMLKQYHADRTGRPDFALMSYGGTIISIRCTQTYTKDSGNIYLFGFPLWNVHNKPEVIIKPGIMPGECWAFEGSQGYAVIKLAMPIYVTGFTLEHTPKELTAHGHIKSAPQHFSVWALTELMDKNPLLLGRFRYLDNGESLQYFESEKLDVAVQMVELRIESNHGSIDYTCIYRFRVHGIPA